MAEEKNTNDSQRIKFKFDFGGDPNNDPAFDPAFTGPAQTDTAVVVVKPPSSQKKKEKVDKVAETLSRLPNGVRTNVSLLQDLQEEQSKLLDKRESELRVVMMKYDQLQHPLWEKRKKIVGGEEIGSSHDGVPEFWLRALQNNPEIGEIIEDHDELCLRHLVDVKSTALELKKGFQLEFIFSDNEYFSNSKLVKRYELGNDDMLEDVSGCSIEWKKDRNLTVKRVKKKSGKGGKKTVMKEKPRDSFFRFFAPPSMELEEEFQDMDDFDISELIEADLQLGQTIRHVTLNAVRWFDSSALADFDSDGDDDSDFDEVKGMGNLGIDDSGSDSSDSDSDSEDEDDGVGRIKKGPNQDEEQCKQQ